MQWGFYFNQDRCVGCKTCVTACKNWNDARRGDASFHTNHTDPLTAHEGSDFIDPNTGKTNYPLFRKYYMKESWRRVAAHESGATVEKDGGIIHHDFDLRYLSVSCNHCDKPACMAVCPMNCITKEPSVGAVLVNNSACISCGRCQDACPWGAPQFYSPNFREYAISNPERPKMTKCTLCLDRIKENLRPACVAACWNRALNAAPIGDLNGDSTLPEFASDYVAGLDQKTGPNIRFKKKSEVLMP